MALTMITVVMKNKRCMGGNSNIVNESKGDNYWCLGNWKL